MTKTEIKNIKTYIKVLENILSWEEFDIKIDALRYAILSLEKQIPKKPKIERWNPALCPCCGGELSESAGDGYYNHFYNLEVCKCGQKLNWDAE